MCHQNDVPLYLGIPLAVTLTLVGLGIFAFLIYTIIDTHRSRHD